MADPKENIEAQLAEYVEGTLDAAGRAEIERHLATHAEHRQLITELTSARDILRDLPRASAPHDMTETLQGQLERSALLGEGLEQSGSLLRLNRWPQVVALAAIVILAVGLGFVVYVTLPASSPTAFTVVEKEVPADRGVAAPEGPAAASGPVAGTNRPGQSPERSAMKTAESDWDILLRSARGGVAGPDAPGNAGGGGGPVAEIDPNALAFNPAQPSAGTAALTKFQTIGKDAMPFDLAAAGDNSMIVVMNSQDVRTTDDRVQALFRENRLNWERIDEAAATAAANPVLTADALRPQPRNFKEGGPAEVPESTAGGFARAPAAAEAPAANAPVKAETEPEGAVESARRSAGQIVVRPEASSAGSRARAVPEEAKADGASADEAVADTALREAVTGTRQEVAIRQDEDAGGVDAQKPTAPGDAPLVTAAPGEAPAVAPPVQRLDQAVQAPGQVASAADELTLGQQADSAYGIQRQTQQRYGSTGNQYVVRGITRAEATQLLNSLSKDDALKDAQVYTDQPALASMPEAVMAQQLSLTQQRFNALPPEQAAIRDALVQAQVGEADAPRRLRVGDEVAIEVKELTAPGVTPLVKQKVDADGYIKLQMIPNGIQAAGLTTEGLEAAVADRYRESNLIPAPTVQVTTLTPATQPSPAAEDTAVAGLDNQRAQDDAAAPLQLKQPNVAQAGDDGLERMDLVIIVQDPPAAETGALLEAVPEAAKVPAATDAADAAPTTPVPAEAAPADIDRQPAQPAAPARQ